MTPGVWRFRAMGRVQGVGYRWFARAAAARLGVTGWVANEADGSVVGEVSGEANAVERFMTELERGPAASVVSSVTRTESGADPAAFAQFEIRQ